MPCYYVKLESLRQIDINPEELAWHSLEWLEKSEVIEKISFEQHKFQWKQFIMLSSFT